MLWPRKPEKQQIDVAATHRNTQMHFVTSHENLIILNSGSDPTYPGSDCSTTKHQKRFSPQMVKGEEVGVRFRASKQKDVINRVRTQVHKGFRLQSQVYVRIPWGHKNAACIFSM